MLQHVSRLRTLINMLSTRNCSMNVNPGNLLCFNYNQKTFYELLLQNYGLVCVQQYANESVAGLHFCFLVESSLDAYCSFSVFVNFVTISPKKFLNFFSTYCTWRKLKKYCFCENLIWYKYVFNFPKTFIMINVLHLQKFT